MLNDIGRRTLHAYLILFLHSSPAADPTHDFEYIASRALNTYALGQHVAPKWNLGRALRWQPAVNSGQRPDLGYDIKGRVGKDGDEELAVALRAHPTLMRSVGLYKVMGEAVQAIIGGVYHQFVSLYECRTSIVAHVIVLFSGCLSSSPIVSPTDSAASSHTWTFGLARGISC